MTLIRTVAPGAEPVTLAEAKAHLRIDGDGEDTLIAGLIRAAREEVERSTGLALLEQGWRLLLDRLPADGVVRIRRHPLREIGPVTVYGTEGEATLVDPADYQADLASRPARLKFLHRPQRDRCVNGFEIDFTAGWEAAEDVPALLKQAILALVAHWFEFRAGFGPADQPVSFPPGYDRLVAGFREARL